MNINEVFPSSFLKAADLAGKKHRLTMGEVKMEKLGDDMKPVLYFDGKDKGLVLNKTNTQVIANKYSPETDGWAGNDIVLYPTSVSFQGQMVDAIRVESVMEEADPTDDIPF